LNPTSLAAHHFRRARALDEGPEMTEAVLPEAEEKKLRDLVLLVYVLQAVGFLIGMTWVVGVVINYLKIDDVRNTWLETHFNWQLRTFWLGLAGMAVAWLLMIVKIGVLIGFAVTLWAIYRVVKGWLALNDRKPMYAALV
jgi:uncharacterized membrane protein